MFLGVATIHDDHDWNWAFVSLTILFATVFRVIGKILNMLACPLGLAKNFLVKKATNYTGNFGPKGKCTPILTSIRACLTTTGEL